MKKDTKILKLPIFPQHIEAETALKILGATLLLSGLIFFLGFFYAAVLSKLLPSSENHILSAIQNDRCILHRLIQLKPLFGYGKSSFDLTGDVSFT